MDIRPIDANALRKEILGMKYTKECPSFIFTPVAQEIFNSGVESASFAVTNAPTLSLNTLRDEIYQDAVAHGLWEVEDEVSKNRMLLGEETGYMSALTFTCAQKIKDECHELAMALTEDLFSEELADVIIMSMSVAGKLGIDIDAAIRRKMEINRKRPWKHGKVE